MNVAIAPPTISPPTLKRVGGAAVRALAMCFAVLSLLAIGSMTWPWGKGCGEASSNQAYEIAKSVELYKLVHGAYPGSLDALVRAPRPIMEALPRDPWGNAYAYAFPGVVNVDKFDVRSAGADGVLFTNDDVGNWRRE